MAAGITQKTVGDGNLGTFSASFLSSNAGPSGNLRPATTLYTSADVEIDFTAASPVFPLPVTPVAGLTVAMTGTASTAVTGIGAPGVGKFNYITAISIGNSHATVGTFVELQDGSGGTTFFTLPAAAVYGGATLAFPTPLKQPTSNTALFVKDTTTGANVIVSAVGFQA